VTIKVRFISGKKAGAVLEVPASTARVLIDKGLAEFVPDEYGVARYKTAPYPIYEDSGPECAVIEAPERAIPSKTRPRTAGGMK